MVSYSQRPSFARQQSPDNLLQHAQSSQDLSELINGALLYCKSGQKNQSSAANLNRFLQQTQRVSQLALNQLACNKGDAASLSPRRPLISFRDARLERKLSKTREQCENLREISNENKSQSGKKNMSMQIQDLRSIRDQIKIQKQHQRMISTPTNDCLDNMVQALQEIQSQQRVNSIERQQIANLQQSMQNKTAQINTFSKNSSIVNKDTSTFSNTRNEDNNYICSYKSSFVNDPKIAQSVQNYYSPFVKKTDLSTGNIIVDPVQQILSFTKKSSSKKLLKVSQIELFDNHNKNNNQSIKQSIKIPSQATQSQLHKILSPIASPRNKVIDHKSKFTLNCPQKIKIKLEESILVHTSDNDCQKTEKQQSQDQQRLLSITPLSPSSKIRSPRLSLLSNQSKTKKPNNNVKPKSRLGVTIQNIKIPLLGQSKQLSKTQNKLEQSYKQETKNKKSRNVVDTSLQENSSHHKTQDSLLKLTQGTKTNQSKLTDIMEENLKFDMNKNFRSGSRTFRKPESQKQQSSSSPYSKFPIFKAITNFAQPDTKVISDQSKHYSPNFGVPNDNSYKTSYQLSKLINLQNSSSERDHITLRSDSKARAKQDIKNLNTSQSTVIVSKPQSKLNNVLTSINQDKRQSQERYQSPFLKTTQSQKTQNIKESQNIPKTEDRIRNIEVIDVKRIVQKVPKKKQKRPLIRDQNAKKQRWTQKFAEKIIKEVEEKNKAREQEEFQDNMQMEPIEEESLKWDKGIPTFTIKAYGIQPHITLPQKSSYSPDTTQYFYENNTNQCIIMQNEQTINIENTMRISDISGTSILVQKPLHHHNAQHYLTQKQSNSLKEIENILFNKE